MAGLLTNANYINNTIKPAIKSAIEAQGVTVPSTDSFLDYADRIGEIEGGGSGYQLKDLPTGSISTVNDAAPLPLNALKVSVEAWQEGTGDPSPSNIRPIHGWDSAKLFAKGHSLINKYKYICEIGTSETNATYVDSFEAQAGKTYTISCYQDNDIATSTRNTLQIGTTGGYVQESNSTNYHQSKGVHSITYTSESNQTISIYYWGHTLSTASTFSGWMVTESDSYIDYPMYSQDFPQTIYGAEGDVVGGEYEDVMGYKDLGSYIWTKLGDAGRFYTHAQLSDNIKPVASTASVGNIICSNYQAISQNYLTNNNIGISIDNSEAPYINIFDPQYASVNAETFRTAMNGVQLVYELATPTTINLSPLSIRMLEGTNNLYADCGDIIDGEYFVDDGAIDVRKVDYQIGSSGSIKTTDGRVLSGFASMSGYHARPLDASGNWLDVDWSKDFEIGVAFKLTSLPTYQFLFGCGLTTNDRFKQPRLFYDNSTQTVELNISTDGSSWESITLTNNGIVADKWYFVKIKFTLSTLKLIASISEDLSTFATMCDETLSGAVYHNSASLSIGGDTNNSAMTSNNCLVDTFNTYIKGDGVSWGASTGVFPS